MEFSFFLATSQKHLVMNSQTADESQISDDIMKLVTKKKISWKHLMQVINPDHNLMDHLFRSPEVQRNYYLHRQKTRKFYASVEDYIKISLLNFGYMDGPDGRIISFQTPKSMSWTWVENSYPYSLRKGIHHYNLWSLQPMTHEEVDRTLEMCIPTSKNFLWFVNEPRNMSIPGIWHCHVFWKQ